MEKQKKRLWLFLPPAVLLLLLAVILIYFGVYYHASPEAEEALQGSGTVKVEKTAYGWWFDGPSETDALIFYPGAKVEETAYAPFLRCLAEKGVDVCLVRMPLRFAILGIGKADTVMAAHSYDHWYIGGHSLGGAMAAVYAASHPEPEGVVLCAAYPTRPLDREDIEVLIYGSEDRVVSRDRILEGRQYASERIYEWEIPGGNHAQFGNYGEQAGDGTASIPASVQQERAAEYILEALRRG